MVNMKEYRSEWDGLGDVSDLFPIWKFIHRIQDAIVEMYRPQDPAFYVKVTIHGESMDDIQIDYLSEFGYIVRLGNGSVEPHSPIVATRFISFNEDGVSSMGEAVDHAITEISTVLKNTQNISGVHVMEEEAWDRCEQCQDSFNLLLSSD